MSAFLRPPARIGAAAPNRLLSEGVAGEFARGRDKHGLANDREFEARSDLPYGLPAPDDVHIVLNWK